LLLKKYSDYNSEDFLDDERFRKWMDSHEREESDFWERFNTEFPEKANDLMLAKSIFRSLRLPSEPGDRKIKARIWNDVQNTIGEDEFEDQTSPAVRPLLAWWMTAAAILIVGGLAWMLTVTYKGDRLDYIAQINSVDVPLQETVNTTKINQTVTLKDGSTVKLNPGSKLSYSAFSDNQRVVYLDGEGFFDVVRDPAKPFIVYAGRIKVQVVGTSFHVRSTTGTARSDVFVVSGKVKVFAVSGSGSLGKSKEEQSVYLTPNQKVVFDASTSIFKKGIVEKPVMLAGNTKTFSFTNTSVSEILSALETAYGVRIRYTNTDFESCKVTAPLDNLALFGKLDILCQTLGATYEVFGTEIVISGGSCDL
jgi:transmembrane sensor